MSHYRYSMSNNIQYYRVGRYCMGKDACPIFIGAHYIKTSWTVDNAYSANSILSNVKKSH